MAPMIVNKVDILSPKPGCKHVMVWIASLICVPWMRDVSESAPELIIHILIGRVIW